MYEAIKSHIDRLKNWKIPENDIQTLFYLFYAIALT